jgi:hypothetical protein
LTKHRYYKEIKVHLISKLIIHTWFLLTWMIEFLPWQMSMLYFPNIMCEVKILSRFCSNHLSWKCNASFNYLHIVFNYWLNTFNYKFWDIFAYNIARFITLAICSEYSSILGFQIFIILFVEIIFTTHT